MAKFSRPRVRSGESPPKAGGQAKGPASDLCDYALAVLRRIDKDARRVKAHHKCEFVVDGRVSAWVRHQGDSLRISISCPSDRMEELLAIAESGQVRAIHRKDPEAIKRKSMPIVAKASCENEIDLIMPLVAVARTMRPSAPHAIRDAKDAMVDGEVIGGRAVSPHLEGQRHKRLSARAKRDAGARNACIAAHGTACSVCKIDFEAFYGIIGRGYIHVHHLLPMSETEGPRVVDPVRDLRPVCPNCHAMLHRRSPPHSITELQRIRLAWQLGRDSDPNSL